MIRRIAAEGDRGRPAAAAARSWSPSTACTDPLYRVLRQRTRDARTARAPRVEREVRRRRPVANRPQGLVDPGLPALLALRGPAQDLRVHPQPIRADRQDRRPLPAAEPGGDPRRTRRTSSTAGAHLPRRVLGLRRARGRRRPRRCRWSSWARCASWPTAWASGWARCSPATTPGDRPAQLIAAGADVVYVIEHPLLAAFDPLAHKRRSPTWSGPAPPGHALRGQPARPRARPTRRLLVPVRPHRRLHPARDRRLPQGRRRTSSAILKQTRPALGGNVMATIMTKDSPTQMATVRPGVFKVPPPDLERTGEVVHVPVDARRRRRRPRGDAGRVVRHQGLDPRRGDHRGRRPRLPLAGGLRHLPPAARRRASVACWAPARRSPPPGWRSRTGSRPTTTRSARPARPSSRGCTSRSASPAPCSTSPACRARRSSSRSTRTPRPGSSTTRTSASSGDIETVVPELVRATEGQGMTAPIDVLVVGGGPAGLATAIRLKQQLARHDAGRPRSPSSTRHRAPATTPSPARPSSRRASTSSCPAGATTAGSWSTSSPVERDEMYFLLRAAGDPDPGRSSCRQRDAPRRRRHDLAVAPRGVPGREGRGAWAWSSTTATRPGRCCVEGDRVVGVSLAEVGRDKPTVARSRTTGRPRRSGPASRSSPTARAASSRTQFRERFGGRQEPAGLLARDQGGRRVPGREPVRQQPGDAHPGLAEPGQRLRRRVHLQHGREDRGGRPDPGPRLEVRRPEPPARVRALPRAPVHRGAARGLGHDRDRRQDDPRGRLPSPSASWPSPGPGRRRRRRLRQHGEDQGDPLRDPVRAWPRPTRSSRRWPRPTRRRRALAGYARRLEERGVLPDMRHARNYRPELPVGHLPGRPAVARPEPAARAAAAWSRTPRGRRRAPGWTGEDPGGMDGATFVSLTGSLHREDEPAHMTILDPAKCLRLRGRLRATRARTSARARSTAGTATQIVLSASNCLHCMTCAVKCPLREHPLDAAGGRRGSPLQADVTRGEPVAGPRDDAPSRPGRGVSVQGEQGRRAAARIAGALGRQASPAGRRTDPISSAVPRATSRAGTSVRPESPGTTASARAMTPKTTRSTPA